MICKIDGREIGHGCPPYIIAEISANHNGSIDRALQTIDKAKECGASAVKMQTYTADTMTIDFDGPGFVVEGGLWDGYKLYDLYKWAETPYEWHEIIFEHARRNNVTIFSTPFDETAVDLLENLNTPAYKIASFEILDLPLIECVAKTKKPMIISTGMASETEIDEAVSTARNAGCEDLILLHCISSYPTPIQHANLCQIQNLSERFGVLSGLSDHTLGCTAAITSIPLGASVIEKHFTINRADKGPDSDFSIEPADFKRLCSETYEAWLALGDKNFVRPNVEDSSLTFRRSLYFVKDLPIGHVVTSSDIRRIRPGLGLSPRYNSQVIGKTLKTPVQRGTPTSWDLFE